MKEMQTLKEINTDRCLKPKRVTDPPQLHAFSYGGEDAYGSCVFIRWPTVCGIEIRFVAAKAFVAPLKHKTTPRIKLMGAVTMSRLVDEIVQVLEYKFEFKKIWVDSEVVIYWLLSQSNRYRSFVSSRIQEFQNTHPNVEEEIQFVPGDLNTSDCLTKPISMEKLGEWHRGEYCEFVKLPPELWPGKTSTLEKVDLDSMKSVLEEKSAINRKAYNRRRKKNRKILKVNPKEDQGNICLSIQGNVTVSDIKGGTDSENLGYQLAENYSSWPDLVRSVAFVKVSLQQ